MTVRSPITALAIALLLITAGCANKAKSIQLGAQQFSEQSKAAIEKIDEFRRAETTVATRSSEETRDKFVSLVLKSKRSIDRKTLRRLEDPFRARAKPADADWQIFLGTLRSHHDEFTKIFARLDQGSFLAAPKVKETIPALDKLIGQIAAFAKSIEGNPAEMTRERAGIAATLESIRDDTAKSQDVKELLLAETYRRLEAIEIQERAVTKSVLEESLKAALIGKELRNLIAQYDQLSIDDIMEGISLALNVSGQVLGKDLSALNQKAGGVVADIKKDADLSALFDTALAEVNNARTNVR